MWLKSLVLLSGIFATRIVAGVEVRLSGTGATYRSGRVEIRRSSSEPWGTVCDDGWENMSRQHAQNNSDVVCRMLGFLSAEGYDVDNGFGQGTGEVYLDNTYCVGTESDLSDCPSTGWGISGGCGHHEDVGVICRGSGIKHIRLVGGTPRSGRIEVRRDGSEAWGTICDHYWEQGEADFVCRMHGFRQSKAITHGGNAISQGYGQGSGPIYLQNMKCSDSASDLRYCSSSSVGTQSCTHSEDIGVECDGLEVRLANGTDRSGRVEIRRNDKEAWGTVCNDFWDVRYNGQQNADVVCRMLGFSSAEEFVLADQFGTGIGPIYMDNVRCNGTETDLIDCPATIGWGDGRHDCSHSEDVGVVCQELEPSTKAPTASEEVVRPAAAAAAAYDGQCLLGPEGSNRTVFVDGDVSVPMNRTTGTAVVDLNVYQVNAKFTQPFGQHSFTLASGDREISVNINVYDPAVVRRLIFQAKYSLRCDLLVRNLTRHIIEITARGGIHHIREICDGDCSDFADPQFSCENDTTTIEWLTNVTYSADVTTIPHQLEAKLSENIRHKGAILFLGLYADNHYSIKRPIPDSHGLSLRPMFHSSCIENSMTYNSTLDKCLGD